MAAAKWERWLAPEGLTLLEGWARQGLGEEQIAQNAGVTLPVLRGWVRRFPPIVAALRRGRELVDFEVENALLRRALGFTYVERRVERTDKGAEKTVETVKQSLPDIAAQKFWLQNRRPDLWKDTGGGEDGEGEDGGEAGVILLGDVLPEAEEDGGE